MGESRDKLIRTNQPIVEKAKEGENKINNKTTSWLIASNLTFAFAMLWFIIFSLAGAKELIKKLNPFNVLILLIIFWIFKKECYRRLTKGGNLKSLFVLSIITGIGCLILLVMILADIPFSEQLRF